MIESTVVLIADRIANHHTVSLETHTLELPEDEYFNEIYPGLKTIANRVVHYDSLWEFSENIRRHRQDIVFSIWSGVNSRNRKGLIAAICEANGIRYVGADAYTHIICQDKYMAKNLCKEVGIRVPDSVLLHSEEEIESIKKLKFPVIVKPNFEGGSIGISEENICDTFATAAKLAIKIQRTFSAPAIIEEFFKSKESIL